MPRAVLGLRLADHGRRVIAVEISPPYVDVAVEQWQAEAGRAAILNGDGRNVAALAADRLGTDTLADSGKLAAARPPPVAMHGPAALAAAKIRIRT